MSTTQYVDVQRELQNLENVIAPENIDAIREFVDHQAAEGIGETQQSRQIQSLKAILRHFAPDDFRLRGATESELKEILAGLNRSEYADATKHKFKGSIKKFYKVENGGHDHPDKVNFFTVTRKKATPVTRDDLFTEAELKQVFQSFTNTRDRAFTMVLYESAARPGELLACNIADFTSTGDGDFIFLKGMKGTPDRTNQLVRSGRTIREWLAHHPLGGEVGAIDEPGAPLWVKTEQHACQRCGEIPHNHGDQCPYVPDKGDRMTYNGFLRRFKTACESAGIPKNKRRPYNLRHTRLTEVATFMGYEQLNKFAGWVPGSSRAKVYVHLNNDDVNQAIRENYGLTADDDGTEDVDCPFCGASNEAAYNECRQCGRPLCLEQEVETKEKQRVIDQIVEADFDVEEFLETWQEFKEMQAK